MKRILLIGNSPLPFENELMRPAAGLRTWQFFVPLKKLFDVRLVTIAMPECYGEKISEGWAESARGGLDDRRRFNISKDNPNLLKELQILHDEFQPDAIVAVNTFVSHIVCLLKSHAPIWADLNGWIMAEGQAQAFKMDSNDYLGHYFEMERIIIKRADKISAVSKAEGFALLGELACAGRMVKESFGYNFVEHIANGTEWFEAEDESCGEVGRCGGSCGDVKAGRLGEVGGEMKDGAALSKNPLLEEIPRGSFILFWPGGYNTWVDEFTLFKAVNSAMDKCPNLYFVSTGGEISGLDNSTFAKFKKMIEGSENRDRFVFLGWVNTNHMHNAYSYADAGISVDRRCLETSTGARNRINEMMKFGLPIITTSGSEIAEEVGRIGAGVVVKSGDYTALCIAIVELYQEWRGGEGKESMKFKEYGKKGREYIKKNCNYEFTLKPLLNWLENPHPSPDRGARVKFSGGFAGGLKAMWRYLKQNGFRKSFKKFLQRMKT